MTQNAGAPRVTLGHHVFSTESTLVSLTDNAHSSSPLQWPTEAKLRRDIRHFERQIARLASPNSIWEQGALKCYQVLIKERRKMLNDVKAGEASSA
jgi:hypothetical protein